MKVRPQTEYLFTNYSGQFLSVDGLSHDRNVVCEQTGIDFDYRKCRRTYAQYLIDEGLPMDKLSVILGHVSTKTTEKAYARPRDDRVINEVIEKWESE